MHIADLYGIAVLFFLSGICDGEDTESESCNTHDCAGTSTTTELIDGTCYEDDSSRLLDDFHASATNTPDECIRTCASRGYSYAGVQYTSQCFCGNDEPPTSRIRDSSQCGAKCSGDASLSCGGTWRMNIYTTVKTDNIYVVGGSKSGYLKNSREYLNSAEVFQPGPNTWSEMPPMSTPRESPAVAVINNQLYAVGGRNSQQGPLNTAEKFDPQTGEWTDIANMTTGYGAGAAELNGHVFVVGGHSGGSAVSSVEKLVGNEWQVAASLPQPRNGPGLVELGGKLYAIGGLDGPTPFKSVAVFDGQSWAETRQMQEARWSPGVATMGGRIFVAGGWGEAGKRQRSVEVYDPTTKEWSYVAFMNVGRYRPALVSAGGKLFVFGGKGDGGSDLTSVEMFNPQTNSWTIIGDMKVCAGRVGAGVLRH